MTNIEILCQYLSVIRQELQDLLDGLEGRAISGDTEFLDDERIGRWHGVPN